MAASGEVSFAHGEAPAKPARVQVDHEEITTLTMSPEKIKVKLYSSRIPVRIKPHFYYLSHVEKYSCRYFHYFHVGTLISHHYFVMSRIIYPPDVPLRMSMTFTLTNIRRYERY